MTNLASPVTHYRACWDENDVRQVLETLGRLGDRVSPHLLGMRRHSRKSYVTPVMISFRHKGRLQTSVRTVLPVIGRDLSRSGIGLLSPVIFEPHLLEEENTLLRASNVFRDGAVLDLGLQKPDGEWLWVYGTCVRVCIVQHDFLDVGIRFNGKRNLALDFDFI